MKDRPKTAMPGVKLLMSNGDSGTFWLIIDSNNNIITGNTKPKKREIGSRIISFVVREANIIIFIDTSSTRDRKSTRLNSSHVAISYAVFCLKKKNNDIIH